MRVVPLLVLLTASLTAADGYPPPRFTDPQRIAKLESTFPEVDRLFRAYAADEKISGMVWGVAAAGARSVGGRA